MWWSKSVAAVGVTAMFSGCAYNVQVASQSGAAEVMTTKVRQEKAYLVFGESITTASREVKAGYACGAHTYPMNIGAPLQSSISKTVEAAYPSAVSNGSTRAASADGITMKFDLTDFDPRIHFVTGFWAPTADANVDLAIRARVTDARGKEVLTTTFRGQGHATTDGTCAVGADALAQASQKAIAGAMESFVDKVINTGALDSAFVSTAR